MTKPVTINGVSIILHQTEHGWVSNLDDAIAFNQRRANTDAYLKRLGMAVTRMYPGDHRPIGIPVDCPIPHGLRR